MNVFTVHIDGGGVHAKVRKRIALRDVVGTSRLNFRLSPVDRRGDPITVPIGKCYATIEAARDALEQEVAELRTKLTARFVELDAEPLVEISECLPAVLTVISAAGPRPDEWARIVSRDDGWQLEVLTIVLPGRWDWTNEYFSRDRRRVVEAAQRRGASLA